MNKMQPIKVVLVDDHTVVRRGIRTYLESFSDLEIVGEFESDFREGIKYFSEFIKN